MPQKPPTTHTVEKKKGSGAVAHVWMETTNIFAIYVFSTSVMTSLGEIKDDESVSDAPDPSETTSNQRKLRDRIVSASLANDWETAKGEWEVDYVQMEPGGQCLCGQNPITERYYLRNKQIDTLLERPLGNKCIEHLDSELHAVSVSLYRALGAMNGTPSKKKRKEDVLCMVDRAFEEGVLSQKQKEIYLGIYDFEYKWNDKQKDVLSNLNSIIVMSYTSKREQCPQCESIQLRKVPVQTKNKSWDSFVCSSCTKSCMRCARSIHGKRSLDGNKLTYYCCGKYTS